MRKNKKIISIFLTLVLSFSLFGIDTFATEKNNISVSSVEPIIMEKNFIKQMLDKLEQILSMIGKTGIITIECIDGEGNVILSETHKDLKFGNYSYNAPEIENYTLDDQTPKNVSISRAHKNQKIQFKYSKNAVKPVDPETPLPDANVTLDTVEAMVNADLKEGDTVRTKGYYQINDNGAATYQIMTYDKWWESLPDYLKLVALHPDRIGCNAVLYKNPVDEYGNHTLKNGLIAKIVQEDVVKVEQWGLFPQRKDNTDALVHLFGNIHTGTIEFGKDAKYVMHYRKYNQGREKYKQIMGELPFWLNENSFQNNEYSLISNCRVSSKPSLGNIKDLKLVGNNCEIKVADNEFSVGGSGSDFAIFEFGGVVDGLEITGFNFDCNGLKQQGYYTMDKVKNADGTTSERKSWNHMRTSNHTISYFSSAIGTDAIKNLQVFKDHPELDPKVYGGQVPYEKTEFSNVNIHHNNFYRAGTIVDTSDSGGDFVLIINPCKSENVFIEDNYFEDWGRWVFAVDLGGNGERFYNYKFNRNKCVQTENNYIPRENGEKPYRGLGFIDFECRKAFTNLEICDNYVKGANGFAFNGNGKISENITIENNTSDRSGYPGWRSIYPYSFTFYSVYAKNLKFNNNSITGGSVGLGRTIYDLEMKNNSFKDTGTVGLNMTGNCTVENNTGEGTRGQLFTLGSNYAEWFTDKTSEYYIPKEQRQTNIVFKNNGPGGVCGTLIKISDPEYYKNTSVVFEGNKFNKFAVNAYGLKEFKFTKDQLKKETNGNPIVYAARGLITSDLKPSFGYGYTPAVGGLHFKAGEKVVESWKGLGRNTLRFFTTDLQYSEFMLRGELYCTKEGYVPIGGEFLLTNGDDYWSANKKCSRNTFYIYNDNVYYCAEDGTFGEEPPTHTYGTVKNGTSRLMFFDKLAEVEIRGLEGQYMENTYYNDDSQIRGAGNFCTKILFDKVQPNSKYKITAIDGTKRVIVTYFDENDKAFKTERAESNVMEFTVPENCAQIRVGFHNVNQQEAINGYKLEKK